MFRRIGVRALLMLVMALVASSMAGAEPRVNADATELAPVIPMDGRWEGTTSQGWNIDFDIAASGTMVLFDSYTVTYPCPFGANPSWGHGFGGLGLPVVEGRFVLRNEILSGGTIDPGSSFITRILGEFTSDTMSEGVLLAGMAGFTGETFRTAPCIDRDITWTAERTGPASPSAIDRTTSYQMDVGDDGIGKEGPEDEAPLRLALPVASATAGAEPPVNADTIDAAAAIPMDGQWVGTTSQGRGIEFVVTDSGTNVLFGVYNVSYPCPFADDPSWGHGFSSTVPVDEGRFIFRWGISSERTIDPGSAFISRVRGEFTSETTSEGVLRVGLAAFTGDTIRTAPCIDPDITWTAERTGPASPLVIDRATSYQVFEE